MRHVNEFGVVFDCDGVLVNTEELVWDVWRDLACKHGIELSLEDLRAMTGCTDEESVRYFRRCLPETELSVLEEQFKSAFARARRERTASYADALATLWELQARKIPAAVASNSTTTEVEAALARSELIGLIRAVAGVDQVASPKPSPDLYRLAASRLGCDVVVAVEDSPTGIAAAQAAGLPVLAVDRGAFAVSELAGATRIATAISYSALKSLIA